MASSSYESVKILKRHDNFLNRCVIESSDDKIQFQCVFCPKCGGYDYQSQSINYPESVRCHCIGNSWDFLYMLSCNFGPTHFTHYEQKTLVFQQLLDKTLKYGVSKITYYS